VRVEDAVELGRRREGVKPLDLVLGEVREEARVRLDDLRPVRRFAQPALAVPSDPRRVRQLPQECERLERPRARGPVVAAEEPAVCACALGVSEHGLERGEVAVDVVEDRQHA
jgi:hypothetical protein